MDDMLDDLYEDTQGPLEESDYPECPYLREQAPRIHDFVRFNSYKGKARSNGSFSVTVEGTLWVVRVTDKDRTRSFSATGHNLTECLNTLDQLVATRQVYWRTWGNPTENGKLKKTGTRK